MTKTIIHTDKAPQSVGPYSQGVSIRVDRLVFTAGQIAIDTKTGEIVQGGIEKQTLQVIENLRAVLEAAGTGLEHVVKNHRIPQTHGRFPENERDL